MAAIPAESIGFAEAVAFGPFMWAVYLVLMITIGISAGVIASMLLVAPRNPRF